MLTRIRNFLETTLTHSDTEATAGEREHAIRLATAALLVELSRTDFDASDLERDLILRLVREHFSLNDSESEELLAAADTEADLAVSLHEFTRLLHDHLDVDEKHRIVEMLWRVAYADAVLHRYEDHFVRKVADLLYIPHSELVRIRHKVKSERRKVKSKK